ncbi:MAG: PAS domain-containing protein [Candidatus Omnitrophica bacterium]|nr:PAS domain-containing protein [Candidatus Omnitrophota bacterium]
MEEYRLHTAILDSIPDMAWLKDEQGRFMSVNEPFGKASGFKPEELIGKTDLDIWPKKLAESYRADDLEVMRSKKRKYVQEELSDKEGKIKWIETIKTAIFDAQGKVVGTVGIARDITGRRLLEESLKEKEQKIRAIFDHVFQFIGLMTPDGILIEANKASLEFVGVEAVSVLNKPFWKAPWWSHSKELQQKLRDSIAKAAAGEFVRFEATHLAKDGITHYIDFSLKPVKDESGKIIFIIPEGHDISERKQYEGKLREAYSELELRVKVRTADLSQANDDLRKTERQLRKTMEELEDYRNKLEILVAERTKELEIEIEQRKTAQIKERSLSKQIEFILGATKTGLDIIDQNFYIRYIDPEWARKYGDYQGKKCFEYFMDRKSPCLECALKKAFTTKQAVVSYEVLAKENNRPIQVTSIPFQDESGEWLVAEINADMTEKKKIDDELWRYREHLEDEVAKRTKELIQEVALHKKAEVEKSKLNRDLLKFNKKLKNVSLIDAHTGLYNHRYLYDIIESEFHQARRYAQSLSVIMIDIDYFKSINDVYGVTFGDLVLNQFAKQLKRMVRRYDILIRYSGEEFVIISPRLSRDLALNMAQRLLEALNFINFGNKSHTVKLKLSLAAVSFPEDRANKGVELINLANTVLNKAKEGGGNRAYSSQDIKKQTKTITKKSLKNEEVNSLRNTIEKLNKKSKQGLVESIFAFAKTIELKDHYTGEHVENTVHYATEIAKMLNLPRENIELIKQAAMLHDLGKIGISEHILLKKGKLNKKEFAEIKKHPQIGADIIRPIQFLHNLVPFIFYHHERWDGKGYPSGIKGEDIPMGARIIAIADVYQALISDRPYHKAFSKKKAIEIIKKSSGTQFDPRIVNTFLEVITREK